MRAAGADAERERKESSIGLALQSSDGEDASGSKSAGMGLWAEDIDRIGNAHGEGKGAKLQGVRFSTWGNGVQWENTASAAMASVRYLTLYGDEAVRWAKASTPQASPAFHRLHSIACCLS